MNDILLFVAIFIGVQLLFSLMRKKSDEEQSVALHPNGKPKCPPHKWIYKRLDPADEHDRMICDVCKRQPLQD